MANKNELTGKESICSSTTGGAGGSALVTVSAHSDSKVVTTYITGIIVSITAAPAAAIAVTLTGVQVDGSSSGGTLTFQLSANATAPIVMLFGVHPLRIIPGTDAILTVPAVGGAAVATGTLLFYRGAI